MPALLNHEKLHREMRKRSLKQEPLAEQLGISDRHLRNLLARDTNVSASLLYDISLTLQVPIEELVVVREAPE